MRSLILGWMNLIFEEKMIRIVLILLAIIFLQTFLQDATLNIEKKSQRRTYRTRTICDYRLFDERKRHRKRVYKHLNAHNFKGLHKLMTVRVLCNQHIALYRNRYIELLNHLCRAFLLEKFQYLHRPQGEDVHLRYILA